MSISDSHVLSVYMNREYPVITRGEGIYFYDNSGKKYMDASGGPILCNLGHGLDEMAEVLRDQAKKIAFIFRHDFTNQPLEDAAAKVCQATGHKMDKVFFVSGGTEAVEIGVKLARKFHIDNGSPSRYKVISRWQSYHGATNGALSWSGMTARRADFIPYLNDGSHIAPAYCYRCWYKKSPETCDLECAQALENEIMCLGPETVAVFLAEPVSGMSLCGAMPRLDYFKRIREICDKYGVLLMLDEVMSGCGRTGKMFAYEHFDTVPDIMALGKGLGGGYFPIGAAVVTSEIAGTIAKNSGFFGSGHSWGGNPLGAAVVSKTFDLLIEKDLVNRSAEMGDYLKTKLESLKSHPHVGDVRGKGLMVGIEFVKDKETKQPFEPATNFSVQVAQECLKRGMFIEYSGGCDRGQTGDMIMFGPPFIITKEQIDEAVATLAEVLALGFSTSAGVKSSF